jgi:hypothetical protein
MSNAGTMGTTTDISAGTSRKLALALVFWSITIFAFAVRFLLLDRESVWLDEAFSWGYAKIPLDRLWWEPIDVHPPVYYSILHLLMRFGDTPWILRIPSAIGGALAIPLLYLLGRRVAGDWVGLGAAALLATSAIEIRYSQEARSYALLGSAALVVVIGFVGLFARPTLTRRETIGWSVVYGGACIVALYLHYISVLLVGVTFALGTLAVLRGRSSLTAQTWAVTNACIFVAWLWWLPILISQLRDGTPQFTLAPPGLAAIAQGIRALYGEEYVFWDWQGGPAFELLLIACGALGAWLSLRRGSLIGACLVAAGFGIPILEVLLSWTIKPVFVERTIIWLIPFYFLLVMMGLKSLPRAVGIPIFFAVLVMQAIGTVTYFRTEHNTPWTRLVAQVHGCASPGDIMLVGPGYLQVPLDYATRNAPLPMKAFDIGVSQGNALMQGITLEETFANIRSALTTHPNIWVITSIDYTGPWFDTGIAPFLRDYRLAGRRQFRDVILSMYLPPGGRQISCGRA